jgi:hypothetical protein
MARSNAQSAAAKTVTDEPKYTPTTDLAVYRFVGPILAAAGFILLGLLTPVAVVVAYRRKRPG